MGAWSGALENYTLKEHAALTGQSCGLFLPTVKAQVFALALAHFAKEVGAGAQKRILLVLDQAGYHTAAEGPQAPPHLPSHTIRV